MKNILFLTVLLTLLSSCRSIEKMVNAGQYEKAFRYGVERLANKKKIKTSHVKALEDAYQQLIDHDLRHIADLDASGSIRKYDDIYSIYASMEERAAYLDRILPLVSKDGYRGRFVHLDYHNLISENRKTQISAYESRVKLEISNYEKNGRRASLSSAYDLLQRLTDLSDDSLYRALLDDVTMRILMHDYDIANQTLETAIRSGQKHLARQAYALYSNINKKHTGYRDVLDKRNQAYAAGIDVVLVELSAPGNAPAYTITREILQSLDLPSVSDKWTHYVTHTAAEPDYVARIDLVNIHPGRERESAHTSTVTMEIIDGTEPLLDDDGYALLDTTGKVIMTDRYVTVYADVLELAREKVARMDGKLSIYDHGKNTLLRAVPISQTFVFEDHSLSYRGDIRALGRDKNRLKPQIAPFPSDYQIIEDLAYVLRAEIHKLLASQVYS